MTTNQKAERVRAVIDGILRRLEAGEPVTKDLLLKLPPGTRIRMPVTVEDGPAEGCPVVVIIQRGGVHVELN